MIAASRVILPTQTLRNLKVISKPQIFSHQLTYWRLIVTDYGQKQWPLICIFLYPPSDAESDSCSFTLAFEDEYKLLGNEQLSESESTFKPKSKKTEPIADDSGAPKEKQPSESKSTDEPNRAKRPNPSQTDDSNAPKEKRPKKPSRKSPKDLSV